MEIKFLRIIVILFKVIQVINSQSSEPVCLTRTSELSGTNDDDYVQIECGGDEVMTSCLSFGENDVDEGKRDGEMILMDNSAVVCRAFNGNNGKGVRAYARCCLWSNMVCSYPFTSSRIDDMSTYHVNNVTCPEGDIAVGCMAHSSFSCIRGASPEISAITISTISSNVDQEINSNVCRAYSCRSVTPTASCCRAPGLECHVRTSSRNPLATVNCNPGWTMTGCNVHTSNETSSIPKGSKILNDVCSAYGTGEEGIWAVAICCRTVDTTTTSLQPTTKIMQPTVKPSAETSSAPSNTMRSECNALATPTNAYTVGGSRTVYYTGDTVMFDCQDGFKRNSGDNQRTCESNGQWSGTELECTKSGIYVPQYALFVAGGALFLLVLCFICLICYKRSQLEKEKPEEIYITSGSSVCSHQSSVFLSPIYEKLPQLALVKSKTLPSRPPKLPHRCPSCNGLNSSHHLHVPMTRSMTRPHSLPPNTSKQHNLYVKYNKRGKQHLYDVPPIETHFDPNYELPKQDPPPPPPPGSKRPTSRHSMPSNTVNDLKRSPSGSPTGVSAGRPGSQETEWSVHPKQTQATSNSDKKLELTGIPISSLSTENGNLVDGYITQACLSSTEGNPEFINGNLSHGINIQVSEL